MNQPLNSWLPFLIPLFPLLGFVVNGIFGRRLGKRGAGFVACLAPVISFGIAASSFLTCLVVQHFGETEKTWAGLQTAIGPWMAVGEGVGGFKAEFIFQLDHLSLLMCLIVTGVGSLIHIYSVGYMGGESPTRFARYFAYLNLFTGMMLILVTGANLPLLFVGWEGVGLCSYLLIGFEYEEGWKSDAGMKAFIVNRVGDLAFIIGMLILVTLEWDLLGDTAGLTFGAVNSLGAKITDPTGGAQYMLFLAALLLFIGATGKSAQIPLFVWLPDAMAGPTPVSALIHAATMVTAGVYMICRLGVFFLAASYDGVSVLLIVATIGGLTACVAASAALVQTDVKKVLAYSTVSQLGYMFMAVGCAAYSAAVFHLMTHAFFKALLFLGSGAVIHALHGEQNMFKMGGLWKKLPVTFAAFVVGGACLMGVPGTSGFFSKDGVIWAVYERCFVLGWPASWTFILGLGLLGALMTAFYTTRMIFVTFLGETRLSEDELGHLHLPDSAMKSALYALIVLSLLGGFVGVPKVFAEHGDRIGAYLKPSIPASFPVYQTWYKTEREHLTEHDPEALKKAGLSKELAEKFHHEHHHAELVSMGISVALVLLGLILGWMVYGGRTLPEDPVPGSAKALGQEFLIDAWGLDALYQTVIVGPLVVVSKACHRYVDEGLIDNAVVDGTGRLSTWVGDFVSSWQTGLVSRAALTMAVGAVVLLWIALQNGLTGL